MDVYTQLSRVFNACSELNFGRTLSPAQVEAYLEGPVMFCEVYANPDIKAALFIHMSGQCGFIIDSPQNLRPAYKHIVPVFSTFVLSLNETDRTKLWCVVLNKNTAVRKLVQRLGFVEDMQDYEKTMYTYKGV